LLIFTNLWFQRLDAYCKDEKGRRNRTEKGRRNRIAIRVVTPPPGVRLVPMPMSSSTTDQSSTHKDEDEEA
jgi:hypothetical protein